MRRLHDLGYSGYVYLWTLIPLVNIAMFFPLCMFSGVEHENEYGPALRPKSAPKADVSNPVNGLAQARERSHDPRSELFPGPVASTPESIGKAVGSALAVAMTSSVAFANSVKKAAVISRNCTQCGVLLSRDSNFCPSCGTSAQIANATCTNCNAHLQPLDRYCKGCGTQVVS